MKSFGVTNHDKYKECAHWLNMYHIKGVMNSACCMQRIYHNDNYDNKMANTGNYKKWDLKLLRFCAFFLLDL